MKKSLILLAVAALGLATSCKKELTCSCNFTTTSVASTNSNTTTDVFTYSSKQTIDKMSKKDAKYETTCYDYKTVNTSSSGTGSFTTNYTNTTDASCKLD
jgi:hypothetical protein